MLQRTRADHFEDRLHLLGDGAEAHQVIEGEAVLLELSDGECGPSMASGGAMTFTREPSGRRASHIGLLSSTRRPTWLTMRWQMFMSCWLSAKRTLVFCVLPSTS